jgi:hypothetical protein
MKEKVFDKILAHVDDTRENPSGRRYRKKSKDFKAFTPTQLFFDGGFNVIDATMLRADAKYYLIVKDQTRNSLQKNLRIAVAASTFG